MASVFIIESGSYSDRHIYGVFSTRELAKKHEKFVPESSGVQEWPVDSIKDDENRRLLVGMEKDGSIYFIDDANYSKIGFDEYDAGDRKLLYWVVATGDVTKAVKIVNEKRIQILAMNLWGNEEGTREYFGV